MPANGIMSALIALESMFFFPQGCLIVDTAMTNPNDFHTSTIILCPTEYSNVLQLPQSIMKGEGINITRGHLDESTLVELRDDLINNWDIRFSNPDYRPCKIFSGSPVDRTSNRQIYKKGNLSKNSHPMFRPLSGPHP